MTPNPNSGLCGACQHGQMVPAARSIFWMCRLAKQDPNFARYPAIPVRQCSGYVAGAEVIGSPDED